jgi:hypothetical protein
LAGVAIAGLAGCEHVHVPPLQLYVFGRETNVMPLPGKVTPMGNDTFAISVHEFEYPSETAEDLREKLLQMFQARAEQITDKGKYDRFELLKFEITHEVKGGKSIPYGRGTIRCVR